MCCYKVIYTILVDIRLYKYNFTYVNLFLCINTNVMRLHM